VAHLHRNVPGVLATVNGILAEHDVNVEGQLLSTSGELGYVLTDVGSDLAESALTALGTMPETIRLRVLS
jgi:D-3-phosphoglycerate dehydrogenase